ncbi:MAG: hypothetical protein WBV69_02850 [Candidatus Sulfotelmatobacter sp.]
MKVAVLLLFPALALAQQSATTSAQCSPIAPNNTGTITIKCSGLSPDQAKSLAGIPSLINKILQGQKDQTAEIMSRLSDCVEGIKQARHGIYSGYDFNGAKRDQRPGVISLNTGPEVTVFQHLLDLQQQKDWKGLLEASEDQIKKTPDWLTPYLFSGIANLNLGNRDAGIKRLAYVKSEEEGNPDYADAARILSQLGEN